MYVAIVWLNTHRTWIRLGGLFPTWQAGWDYCHEHNLTCYPTSYPAYHVMLEAKLYCL